jgi:hypothetical protein
MLNIFKKKSIYSFSILLMVIVFASCSKTPANLQVIPKTATLVSSIDVFSIATKARLDQLSDLKIVKEAMVKMGGASDNSKMGAFFQKVMESPLSSGVDFTTDVYIFNTSDDLKNPIFGASIEITNKNEFNTFVTGLSAAFETDIAIETENDINYVNIDNNLHIGWDEEKAILLASPNRSNTTELPTEIARLMKLTQEDQLISKEEFKIYHAKKKDLSIWISSNLFASQPEYKRAVDQVGFDLNDIYFYANIEFNDDQIKLTTDFIPNEGYQAILERSEKLLLPFNKEVAGMFSDNYKGLLAFGIDFSKISDVYSDEKVKGMIDLAEDKLSPFGGSFLIDFYDIEVYQATKFDYFSGSQKQTEDVKPKFSLGFDISNLSKLDTLINQVSAMGMCEKKENYYIGSFGKDFTFAFGVNNNLGMISMDEGYVRQFANGEKPNSTLIDDPIMKEIQNHTFYTYVKLDIEDYSDEFQKFVKNKDITPKNTGLKTYKKLFKSFEMKRISATKSELNLNFKESNDNILQDLIKITDQAYIDMAI